MGPMVWREPTNRRRARSIRLGPFGLIGPAAIAVILIAVVSTLPLASGAPAPKLLLVAPYTSSIVRLFSAGPNGGPCNSVSVQVPPSFNVTTGAFRFSAALRTSSCSNLTVSGVEGFLQLGSPAFKALATGFHVVEASVRAVYSAALNVTIANSSRGVASCDYTIETFVWLQDLTNNTTLYSRTTELASGGIGYVNSSLSIPTSTVRGITYDNSTLLGGHVYRALVALIVLLDTEVVFIPPNVTLTAAVNMGTGSRQGDLLGIAVL